MTKAQRKKRIPFEKVPVSVKEAILCALCFENAIRIALKELVDESSDSEEDHGIHSAGLALAVAAMTSPKSKLFAKMIGEVSSSAISDYNNVKNMISDHFQMPNKNLMH